MSLKFRTSKEARAFLLGSLGMIGLLVLILHFTIGCATSPISSFEACQSYCSKQGKFGAFVTMRHYKPCQECICFSTMDELFEDGRK